MWLFQLKQFQTTILMWLELLLVVKNIVGSGENTG